MKKIRTLRIHCLSEAISLISQMKGTVRNESVINKEKVLYGGTIREVPVLSGNTLRHNMVRVSGALHLIKICELEGKLNFDQLNYLFAGGNLTKSATGNFPRIVEMQTLLPLIRLLGGSLANQIVSGSLMVGRGILVCEENRENIKKMLPPGFELPYQILRSCDDFIDRYQYIRGDSRFRDGVIAIDLLGKEYTEDDKLRMKAEYKTNQMIYTGESLIPGSVFYHDFTLQNISPLEIGALLNALFEWDKLGGTIGGATRIGHGRLQTSFWLGTEDEYTSEINVEELIKAYNEHCKENKEKIIKWLMSTFPMVQARKAGRPPSIKNEEESSQGEEEEEIE